MLLCDDVLHWAETYTGAPCRALGRFTCIGIITPFTFHMTDVAERHKILQNIGFGRLFKIGKADNVMHIQLLPVLLLRYATILAGIVITLTRCSALCFPIRAIVRLIAATPCSIIRSAIAFICTVRGAKTEFPRRRKLPSWDCHSLLTFLTGENDWRFVRLASTAVSSTFPPLSAFLRNHIGDSFGTDYAKRTPFIKAITGTDRCVFCITDTGGLGQKIFPAYWANQLLLCHALLLAQNIRTCTRACRLTPPFQPLRISKIDSATDGANGFNHAEIVA